MENVVAHRYIFMFHLKIMKMLRDKRKRKRKKNTGKKYILPVVKVAKSNEGNCKEVCVTVGAFSSVWYITMLLIVLNRTW